MKTRTFFSIQNFLLLSLTLLFSATLCAQEFIIKPEFKKFELVENSWNGDDCDLIVNLKIPIRESSINAVRVDQENWELTRAKTKGSAKIISDESEGIRWEFTWQKKKFSVLISSDYENTNDPRLMTIRIDNNIWYMHNCEPDLNSCWILSKSDYIDNSAIELASLVFNIDYENDDWDPKSDWLLNYANPDLGETLKIAFVLSGILAMNVRYGRDLR